MSDERSGQRLSNDLIEACQRGDRDAFRQLFETYGDRVWTIALHFTGDDAAARDISQQVFLKLFSTIGQFRHDSSFTTWLHRLVVNACLDERRRRSRFISFDFFGRNDEEENAVVMDGKLTEEPRQEERFSRIELSATVKAAVKELKPKLRIAILLKYFEGLSYDEMARVLGCSPGTVASRLNRGHKELARRLAHLKP